MIRGVFELKPIEDLEFVRGPFYVLEAFPYLQFVENEDGPIRFETCNDAINEAEDCQQGIVIAF